MSDTLPPEEAVALLCRVAAEADRAAFATLFAHFAPRLKTYLMRLGLPSAGAEELAQETMLTVWRQAAQFDPASTGVAGWIFTIARNRRLDAARRDQVRSRLRDHLDPAQLETSAPPVADTALDEAERGARLHQALRHLPADQLEVLRLSFFDERPHAEIERALGIPLGTVKSRLRLGMMRLRKLLDDMQ
ncbi:sigma-70 family RNA polymerase sigma factor [Rhodovarius crocodyli]|uniref:sigma-70 family RNA polymerase sigma factor n=1 Tax=Rhodovarius crocodyli TaxID=1979269 RepID=UPI001F0C59C9|nr:sigma-70 family RNA polymerase sigma factor [Rhodovarius crocodyli]